MPHARPILKLYGADVYVSIKAEAKKEGKELVYVLYVSEIDKLGSEETPVIRLDAVLDLLKVS